VTLLDRPYRRLVEDVPVRYVGFTVPDELFVEYGFDLQERYGTCPTCTSCSARTPQPERTGSISRDVPQPA
jgi:hypoxanthine-guanine phosphoribosyltransferase